MASIVRSRRSRRY